MSAFDAALARQSWSKVGEEAPSRDELLRLVAAAGRVADHSSLRPWRLIELRGADREALGAAIAAAQGDAEPSGKPLRAPLLVAVVASYRRSDKVPRWEQEAVASGVAHTLSLLLDEAGWGVIWRTGHYTRSAEVAAAHGLRHDEELLGWLYVGSKPADKRPGRRTPVDAEAVVTRMPSPTAADGPSPTRPSPRIRDEEDELEKRAKKLEKKHRKREKKRRKREAKRRKKDARRMREEQ